MLYPETMRERITVQKLKASPTVDGLGHIDPANADNWETHCEAFAEVSEVGSGLAKRVGVTRETTTHVIRVRYCAGHKAISGAMRVKRRDGTFLAIATAPRDPDQRSVELVFEAQAGAL